MSFRMLACDYDATLADQGVIAPETEQALVAAKNAGLMLGIVTGRMVQSLLRLCPQINLFDLVVAENGAVLYFPASEASELLDRPPPPEFIAELTRRAVPFYVGQGLVGLKRQYESEALAVIHELKLDLRIIVNKVDGMVLPVGIDKASGLAAGLKRLGLERSAVVGIGDAENDLELFQAVGYRVAVANALDVLKAEADLVTRAPNGAGVTEFIREHLLTSHSR